MDEAIDVDNRYWEMLATGQDSEEAESSGYLVGFRDALSAVHTFIAYGDESTLREYLEATMSLVADKEEELS